MCVQMPKQDCLRQGKEVRTPRILLTEDQNAEQSLRHGELATS